MPYSFFSSFIEADFNAEKFVKDLSSQCVGAEELRQQRAKIQELSDTTSALLKHNVYQNYIQFIETAKEISHLESEMYQLSQLLSEQRSLLSVLATNQNAGIVLEDDEFIQNNILDVQSKENEAKQKLTKLLENVEGAASLVETPGRICLYEGSLLELDPLDGTPLKRIHAYLFNDILMISSWLSNNNKRGPPKYRMQVVYDLKSLAVVNVKDLGSVKLALKLLAFPDTRIFQCPTATNKKEWLEKCDQAKKSRISQERSIIIDQQQPIIYKQLLAPSRLLSLESNIVCIENEIEVKDESPDWLLETTEDLDSYIAQRHFEDAYNLFYKAKSYIGSNKTGQHLKKIEIALNDRADKLINVITKEMESSADAKSLQGGGLRSARRAVRLLIQLERTAKACQLYLRLCSAALKGSIKRVKREGSTVAYVKQVSAIAFSNMAEVAREFLKSFTCDTTCSSALIVWCSNELRLLASHLIKQMFVPQVSLSTLVECIVLIRSHCEQLTQVGTDFYYQWDGHIRTSLSQTLKETGEKYMDAVKIRAAEDSLKPSYFQKPQNLRKILSELDYLGIPIPECYIKNQCWISITNNTLTFSKMYIGLLEDCLNVATHELINTIEEVLFLVLRVQVRYLQTILHTSKLDQERQLINDNAKYLYDVVITRSLELHEAVTGYKFTKLLSLQEQLRHESLNIDRKPEPTSRSSISKYSTTEYI